MADRFPAIDFTDFHERELPARIAAGNGAHAFAATQALRPLALRVPDGPAYTYVPENGSITVRPGARDAATEVEIEARDFSDLVHDLAGGAGLFYPGRVKILRGKGQRFLDWEPGWRALFHGRPVFDPSRLDLRDASGAPLDCARSFAPDDDPAEMGHFLATAGYLHVRSVFTAAEIERFRTAGTRLAAKATEDDGNSWWGVTTSGEKRLTRVLDARADPVLHDLVEEPRLTRLVDLVDADLTPDVDGEAVTVLFKVKDIAEGLANLPWHRDCGMGGHAIGCPTLNVSLFLTPANRETGGLWMLPGSHPYTCPPSLFRDDEPVGSIVLDAAPGDVSLHLSDTMHAAFPPTGDGVMRESLVLTWKPPGARPHDGQSHYNDAIKGDGGVPLAGRRPQSI